MRVIESLAWLWISIGFVGAIAVIIGVWGEEWSDRRVLPYHKQERLKTMYWVILLAGLSLDVIGLAGSTFTSVALETKVEELRRSNLELEAKLQPRTITSKQRKDFIKLTKGLFKFPVKVFCPAGDNEAFRYAVEIREMLNDAGFGTKGEPVQEVEGVFTRELPDSPHQFSEADIACAWYGTNKTTALFKPADIVRVSPNELDFGSTNSAFVIVLWAFRQIDIRPAGANDDKLLKPNEFAVFVPPKNH